MPSIDSGFSIMFFIVPFIIAFGCILIFALILSQIVRNAKQNRINNNSPVLSVEAKIVTKRSDIRGHHRDAINDMNYGTYATTYYVTFEVASGDRMEFKVSDSEYGLLVENDFGSLTFQGTRYISFERYR